MMAEIPEIIQRIRSHGGMAGIHVIPVTELDPDQPDDYGTLRHAGWGNVVACRDGTRIALTLEDEQALKTHRVDG